MTVTGNGLCPDEPAHGRLLSWEDGRWYCPARDHERFGSPLYALSYVDGKQVYKQATRVDDATPDDVPSRKRKKGPAPA